MVEKQDQITNASIGLNTDLTASMVTPGMLTWAVNAGVESFDGNQLLYSNDAGNTFCVDFPEGYKYVGGKNITELSKVIYFITNPETGNSQIGYSDNGECIYRTLLDDNQVGSNKLNFSILHPIKKVIPKTTNCSTQLYWTDNFNPRRYLDLTDLPYQEGTTLLDANKLLVQPNYSIPQVITNRVVNGGRLIMGTYQFAVQYCNFEGDAYTSYFNVSNPIGIFELVESADFNLQTTKAISFTVKNIDTTGLFDYFNVAVVKTINNISSVDLVGTFRINTSTFDCTYTGSEQSPIKLSISDIFEKYQYYDKAEDVFEADNVLGWSNLVSSEDVNYQSIWSNVHLQWETHKVQVDNKNIPRGYMRDEVYAFEGCFLLKNGMQTKSFHIAGRTIFPGEEAVVDNDDSKSIVDDNCSLPESLPKWKVYNTGTLIDFTDEYKNRTTADDCYEGSFQYGEMAFWESSDSYPNNPVIWGPLANQKIRHHKFPDIAITKIHDDNTSGDPNFKHSIYPIGIRVDTQSLYKAIADSIQAGYLTRQQVDQIAGFKISRGNRSANKSIIAKGIFNNVGEYAPQILSGDPTQDNIAYANYPYNDLRSDPYFSSKKVNNHTGYNSQTRLQGFTNDSARSRYVFHSPDTHFYQPSIGVGNFIKVDTIEHGESYGHFVKVERNAQYQFLLRNAISTAAGVALASTVASSNSNSGLFGYVVDVISSAFSGGTGGFATKLEQAIPVFNETLDLIKKLTPFNNFGYNFNSYGLYNKSWVIPNNGNKIRQAQFSKYLNEGINTIENGKLLNNFKRESSVYINTNNSLPFTTEVDSSLEDNSRYNLASFYGLDLLSEFINLIVTGGSSNTPGLSNNDILSYLQNQANSTGILYKFKFETSLQTTTVGTIYQWKTGSIVYGNFEVVEFVRTPSTHIPGTYDGYITLQILSGAPGNLGENSTGDTLEKVSGTGFFTTLTFKNTTFQLISDFFNQDSSHRVQYIVDIRPLLNAISAQDVVNGYLTPPPTTAPIATFLFQSAYYIFYNAYQNYVVTKDIAQTPETIRKSKIASYYGAIKQQIDNQWGQVYSYEVIDTGYYQKLYQPDNTQWNILPTVFGGDIFINRFALKTKVPIFIDNTVNQADGLDINYDELGNYGYPMFWYSTKDIEDPNLQDLVSNINNFAQVSTSFGNVLGMGVPGMIAGFNLAQALLQEIVRTLGVKNTNLDSYQKKEEYELGISYLFVYGIPYYFVESEVNIDYRQATNALEGNFYPNVGGIIPDQWLQEVNVPIAQDNSYHYNQTYSKQNKEDVFAHLREDWTPFNTCLTNFPNRAIWSDKSSLEETKNNWLIYKPGNVKDFTKSYGKLTSIDKLQGITLLARFENKSQVYNAQTQLNLQDVPGNAYIGNPNMFAAPPVDLSTDTDSGYAGSQHMMLLKTEFGHVYIDALRGQVLLVQGTKLIDIADRGMDKWFTRNSELQVQKYFPQIDIDNIFNGVGYTGVYDQFYQRVLITKKDYIPKKTGIFYDNGKFFYDLCQAIIEANNTAGIQRQANFICRDQPKEIQLTDSNYFCDNSWTVSYNFKTQSWISFHSFIPNYYIPFPNYFQTGLNSGEGIWTHNRTTSLFNNYYGKKYEYILEYPYNYKGEEDQILWNIEDYTTVLKYIDQTLFTEPDEVLYFNKCILYNRQQCSGLRNLIPKKTGDLSQFSKFPGYNTDSIDILVAKNDHIFSFNQVWDIVKDKTKPFFKTTCEPSLDKELDNTQLDYSQRPYKKVQLRAKDLKLRLIQDTQDQYKFISRFIISPTTNSYL